MRIHAAKEYDGISLRGHQNNKAQGINYSAIVESLQEVQRAKEEAQRAEERSKRAAEEAEKAINRLESIEEEARAEMQHAVGLLQGCAKASASHPVINHPAGTILGADILKAAFYVAIDMEGQVLVSDEELHQVIIFNRGESVARRLGSKGSSPGQFNQPRGIAVDRQGHIIVADSGNHRIQVLRADGSVVHCFGSWGGEVGQLIHPSGVAIDTEGHIVVADSGNDRIQIFNLDGSVVHHFGSNRKGAVIAHLNFPLDVAVDGAGRIVVPDYRGVVHVFNGDGSVAMSFGSKGDTPGQRGVTVDREGRIFVADTANNLIKVFNSDGSAAVNGRLHLSSPVGVAVDGAGRIVVVEALRLSHVVLVL